MNSRDYLKQLQLLDVKISQKLEEAYNLKLLAESTGSIAPDPDKVQTSVSGDKMAGMVAKYVDLEHRIDQMVDRYVYMRDRIIDQIHELTDPRFIRLLYLHYVPDVQQHRVKRLEEIACIMTRADGSPYSYDHIKRLHGWALQAFQKILDNS